MAPRCTTRLALLVAALALALAPPVGAKLPKSMDKALLCDACGAVVAEGSKLVAKSAGRLGRENAVYAVLEDLCKGAVRHFRTYDHPPPKMGQGCVAIVAEYEEELERALYDGVAVADATADICKVACEGVDKDAKPATDTTVLLDGRPVDATTMRPVGEDDDDDDDGADGVGGQEAATGAAGRGAEGGEL